MFKQLYYVYNLGYVMNVMYLNYVSKLKYLTIWIQFPGLEHHAAFAV